MAKFCIRKYVEIEDFGDRVEAARKEQGLTVVEACELIGISRQYWYDLLGERTDTFLLETLRSFESVLKIDFGVKL